MVSSGLASLDHNEFCGLKSCISFALFLVIQQEKFKKGLSQKACCKGAGGSRHDSGDEEGEDIPMTTNAGKPQETHETHV